MSKLLVDTLVDQHPLVQKKIKILTEHTKELQKLHRYRKALFVLEDFTAQLAGQAPISRHEEQASTAPTYEELVEQAKTDLQIRYYLSVT